MKFSKLLTIFACLGLFIFANTALAYYNLGQPAGFVNDFSKTLTIEQKQQLENKLISFERETSNEISAVIIDDLQNDTIENFAVKLFEEWGIGKEGKDNGILILVAKNNREMRIEVGYGLEGALTDAQAGSIINQIMKPAFRDNNFYKGIDGAIDKIILATKGEYQASQSNSNNSSNWDMMVFLIFLGFIWLSAILGRSKSWWFGGLLGCIIGFIVGVVRGSVYFGVISIIILLPVGLLFDYIVSKQYSLGKKRGNVPWWIGGGGRGPGGVSGGGGGFGGFGGGMSGGGGSSGSW